MDNNHSIEFANGEMSIRFDHFDLDSYRLFLKAKAIPEYRVEWDEANDHYRIIAPARFSGMIGVERPPALASDLPFNPCLYDDQVAIVSMALESKRFAVWSDCGLGKSLIEFEFARQAVHRTGGKALLVSLNDVVPQFLDEAKLFYPDMPLIRLNTQADMIAWCDEPGSGIAITNYEKFNPKNLADGFIPQVSKLACIIVDENRLKGGGDSRQKKVINRSCQGIEYKLTCTATPAPNDTIEFTGQAKFLEKVRTDQDIIWSYFTRNTTTHRRDVRPHARKAFFEFMASWSVYLKNPKRFGWRLELPEVPEPDYFTHPIASTEAQRKESLRIVTNKTGTGSLFISRETNAIERSKLAQVARGFRYLKSDSKRIVKPIDSLKPAFVADLAQSEVEAGHQVLLWTTFDEESAILSRMLSDAGQPFALLTGATKEDDRLTILERFRDGEVRCLISRPKMLGYGLNFQHCSSMIFSGFSESFEELYQAVRRAVRHGQKLRVRVHFPVVEDLEGETFANLMRKAREHERSTAEMEDNYLMSFHRLQGKAIAS